MYRFTVTDKLRCIIDVAMDRTHSLERGAPRHEGRIRIEAGRQAIELSPGETKRIGSSSDADLVLQDTTVSRQHLEVTLGEDGLVMTDLGSKNGSWFGGSQFTRLVIAPPAAIRVGAVELRIRAAETRETARFGELVAVSAAMRAAFDVMTKVAASDLPILIRGETGTGKELAARAIHTASRRADKPYVVVDLAALTPGVIESELFGHARGAFTGATTDRAGAFDDARGGTVFLDEIGELDLEVQPRLLRVLESGEVKRVGENTYKQTRARIVAATNRDLTEEIAATRFRSDLFHRLAGIEIVLPPLRDRLDDLPVLIDHFANSRSSTMPPIDLPGETLAAMTHYAWPGNVRQLYKVIERAAVLAGGGAITPQLLGLTEAPDVEPAEPLTGDVGPFKEAKQRLVDAWELDYVRRLLAAADGNVTRAASLAGLARVHLHRLLRKHRLG
jgi:two-component system nitrogen regulation response regulator GlnG